MMVYKNNVMTTRYIFLQKKNKDNQDNHHDATGHSHSNTLQLILSLNMNGVYFRATGNCDIHRDLQRRTRDLPYTSKIYMYIYFIHKYILLSF